LLGCVAQFAGPVEHAESAGEACRTERPPPLPKGAKGNLMATSASTPDPSNTGCLSLIGATARSRSSWRSALLPSATHSEAHHRQRMFSPPIRAPRSPEARLKRAMPEKCGRLGLCRKRANNRMAVKAIYCSRSSPAKNSRSAFAPALSAPRFDA
jgi:hypothetical protein